MAKPPARITCKECGKRRVKAIVTHPITSKQRRTPLKICQECHGKTMDYRFFSSQFGQWLRKACFRQCTNSIPMDTNELRGLLHVWKFHKKACGFSSDGIEVSKTYNYQLCHIDPVKGPNDLVGRLNFSNLMIAPANLNRELSNLPFPFTSKQSTTRGETITDDNFVTICRERYDLPLLITEFCLTAVKRGRELSIFKSDGIDTAQLLLMELRRLGYPASYKLSTKSDRGVSNDEANRIAHDVFETFFKVGGTLASSTLSPHTFGFKDQALEYDFTPPYELLKVKKAQQAQKAAHLTEDF